MQNRIKKKKRLKRNEENLRYVWGSIKHINIQMIKVKKDKEKMKEYEKIFEKITVKSFLNMEKEIDTQVQSF